MIQDKRIRECGCNTYFTDHDSWCSYTPIFANMVREWGGNPFDTWPFIVFSLISPQPKTSK